MDYEDLTWNLRGTWETSENYALIDYMVMPCASKVELFDGRVIGGGKECKGKKETQEYLDTLFNIEVLYN